MRHRVAGKKLNRNSQQRTALLRIMMRQLVEHGHLTTTETKAKVVKQAAEKAINKAKDNSVATQRQLLVDFGDRKTVQKLVSLSSLISKTSGFITMVRLGKRLGDDTMMTKLEVVKDIQEPEVVTKNNQKIEDKKEKK